MRIAISGASGTGKTTLARALADHYEIPLNPVGSRDVAKSMGFEKPYDVDQAGKRVEFQARLFEAKREWELAHEHFVTDRSYFDNLTYCALHMIDHVDEDMAARFMRAMGRYDAVFILPMGNFQNLDDGVRKTSIVYHQIYEDILMGFYQKLALATQPMPFIRTAKLISRHASGRVAEAIALLNVSGIEVP